ncbi:DUF4232 domain-containing protein [Streptomyces sp. SKN60]|uniref:DUF4232 domain-containing protein n=1 Tax=Streptomyces sp. SKN60 TaxID=2855506 RepID=UPI002245FDC8|nr:DUF4232 domain-containing protein [Streptomyces sp. SKN60]MCX2183721.1 DUF4232 domain-containing protein [Streptomyces sp. SKN60]
MTKRTPVLPVLAAAALLLTACGTQPAGIGDVEAGGRAPGAPSARPVDDPGKDGVRITSLTLPPLSPSPSPSSSPSSSDSGISATYEVTNTGTETLTYTVIVTFTDAAGGAMSNQTVTVRDVGPGKTVHGTVRAGELPPSTPRVTGAKVFEVTTVPAGEAPAEDGACPASGIRVYADRGDAAMGLRVVGLHLENCGTRDYTVEGYPLLELLDSRMKPVGGIEVLKGSGKITTGAGPDEPPRRVVLRPAEAATATLVWRNTTEAGTPVTVPHVRVRAKAGAAPVIVTPELDLGTTGRLGVRPWKKAERSAGASAG